MSGATLVAVGVGGALGATARYLVAGGLQGMLGDAFPWGTLGVNVSGSFLLGLLFAAVARGSIPPEFQALLAVGILGSFTTFSAFSLETLALIQEGAWVRAATYALGSLALGLAAVAAGMALAGGLRRP
ncbi:MAG TPA: fluoride efflux transporter CrcB [Longimicrobiales bacterium]|nr:fluoride efflux transporter CrcB [Longimicrobiales bacterium]